MRSQTGHKVLPQHAVQYQELIEDYYKGIHESPDFDARLIGSWEIVVGEVDTFVHVFGYEGISGFEKTKYQIRASEVSLGSIHARCVGSVRFVKS